MNMYTKCSPANPRWYCTLLFFRTHAVSERTYYTHASNGALTPGLAYADNQDFVSFRRTSILIPGMLNNILQ